MALAGQSPVKSTALRQRAAVFSGGVLPAILLLADSSGWAKRTAGKRRCLGKQISFEDINGQEVVSNDNSPIGIRERFACTEQAQA
jgi:hypothetical protein